MPTIRPAFTDNSISKFERAIEGSRQYRQLSYFAENDFEDRNKLKQALDAYRALSKRVRIPEVSNSFFAKW